MPTEENKKTTLPERHETLTMAVNLVRDAESLALINPDDSHIKSILKSANSLLALLKAADDKAFVQYADALAVKVTDPDYPHAIKAWYEDDFKKLIEEIKHDA